VHTGFGAALVTSALCCAGCGGGGDQARAGGAGAGRPEQPPVPVAVTAAHVGSIASYYTATATLAAEKDAEILARVAGVVEEILVEEGDLVSEGEELLGIDNAEYLFRVQQAEAARADLESRYERLRKMLEQNLVSAEEFEGVKNNLEAARAEEGLARLNLSYTRVRAPFTGRVVTRHIEVGHNVSVGTPLFVLSDFDPLLARIHVPAKEFNKLAVDQPVELVLESNGTRMSGRIKLISPVIDPASGTIKVTVEVPEYPQDTRPGDFAQVSIVTERRTGTTLVPKIAVVIDRSEQVVYLAADSTAERRVVEVGFEDDDNAEILSGVEPGAGVVVKGQRSLKHGQRIKVLEEGVAEADSNARAGS
jgi:membrane fusion protein (multidrug efflux system)